MNVMKSGTALKPVRQYLIAAALHLFSVLLFLTAWMSFSAFASHEANISEDIADFIQDAVQWKRRESVGEGEAVLFQDTFLKNAGHSAEDWYAIAIGRTGLEDNYTSYLTTLRTTVQERYMQIGGLDTLKATEWHRIAMAVLALGGDPTDMGMNTEGSTINLIGDGTYNRGKTAPLGQQGLNGWLWGLIALDSMRYSVPEDAFDTRHSMITQILMSQLPTGAFTLDGEHADTDITAMALQALAPYYNSDERFEIERDGSEGRAIVTVREAADAAVKYLSGIQKGQGSFSSWGSDNAESTAQVMVALCSMGIDPVNDPRFIKNGCTVLDGLLQFRCTDGGFAHVLKDGEPASPDSTASSQAILALNALYRYYADLRSLYDFRPEMDGELKERIRTLRGDIAMLPEEITASEQETAAELYDRYLAVPATERCYVFNYNRLADAMQQLGMEYTGEALTVCMNENTEGKGAILNIFEHAADMRITVSESDWAIYRGLPEECSTEHYTVVVRLLYRMENAENREENTAYEEVIRNLREKKAEIEEIQKEIAQINREIAESLYPFDNLTVKDRVLAEKLLERIQKLSEYDQKQILGYEALLQIEMKADDILFGIILAALGSILFIAVTVFLIKWRRAGNRRQAPPNGPAE